MTFDKNQLNELIKEGEKFHMQTIPAHLEPGGYGMIAQIPTMHYLDDAEKFAIWRQKCIRFLSQYFPKDIALIEFRDLDWEKKLTPAKLYDLIGALKALRDNPVICEVKDLPTSQNTITINQNQTQNQTQIFNAVLNSLKDELRGKEYEEIEKILSSNSPNEEKKRSIIEKLKSFGENVVAGVVASILTNGF